MFPNKQIKIYTFQMKHSPKKYNYLADSDQINNEQISRMADHEKNIRINNLIDTQSKRTYQYNLNKTMGLAKTQKSKYDDRSLSNRRDNNKNENKRCVELKKQNANQWAQKQQKYGRVQVKEKGNLFGKSCYPIQLKQSRRKEEAFRAQYIKIKSWYKNKQYKQYPFNAYQKEPQYTSPSKAYYKLKPHQNQSANYNILKEFQKYGAKAQENPINKPLSTIQYYNNQPYLNNQGKEDRGQTVNNKSYFLRFKVNPEQNNKKYALNSYNKPHQQQKMTKRDNSPYRIKNNPSLYTQPSHLSTFQGTSPPQNFKINIISYNNDLNNHRIPLSPRKNLSYLSRYD